MSVADRRRHQLEHRLSQLVWHYPDGSSRALKATAGRFDLWEALRLRLDAVGLARTLTPAEAEAEAFSRRYLEAKILLFLCAHDDAVWEQPRRLDKVELCPLRADFETFLTVIRQWGDEAIPAGERGLSVQVADLLRDHFLGVVVSPDDEDEEDDADDAEKKTPPPDGSPITSGSSARP